MNGFNKRSKRKKEGIRREALELFLAYGLSKVSVKEIASKAGVSPVSIYNYFGSKEGLVRDVVKGYITRAVEKYMAILEGDLPFEAKLRAIIFDKRNLMRSASKEFIQAIVSADPEISSYFNQVYSQMRQNLYRFVSQGQAEGCISAELSPRIIMVYFDILRSGITSNTEVFGSSEPNEELFRQLTEIYLYGLSGWSRAGNNGLKEIPEQ